MSQGSQGGIMPGHDIIVIGASAGGVEALSQRVPRLPAAGLVAIKQRGGVAVVQDPRDALYPGMPRSALEAVPADHVLDLAGIAAALVRLAREPAREEDNPMPDDMEMEAEIAAFEVAAM